MRLIHAVRELAHEWGEPLVTIALSTEADRGALFVREADESYELGPAMWTDPRDGQTKSTYLDYDRLERALVETRAEAVWVGWGFVAEHAEFADLCARLGLVFVGPDGDAMRRLGDKIASKKLAAKSRAPMAGWSEGEVETVEKAVRVARKLGYPVMLKATAGGGGRGIRRLTDEVSLRKVFEGTRSEALRAFGNPGVFLEKAVEGARHIEVQILGDRYGTLWALGVRDCTLQRRNQKILEESPSPALTEKEDRKVRRAAVRIGKAAGYHNAGTVEFLFQPETREFAFMEVNTRLQVEHPVTELVTGLDLVKMQLKVAAGERLTGEPPPSRGHAAEVRLNAEDPENGFAPAPGTIELFRIPTGPGVRVDTGVEEGDRIPQEFDSMIAKIIALGRDRTEALDRLRRALDQTRVTVRGGTTNRAFLRRILDEPAVITSELDVGWLDRRVAAGEHTSHRHTAVALVEAAIAAFRAESRRERLRFFSSANRGRPQLEAANGREVSLGYRGTPYRFLVQQIGKRRFRLEIDDQRVEVDTESLGRSGERLVIAGRSYRTTSSTFGPDHLVEIEGESHRVSLEQAGTVRSPAPAVVVSYEVEPGDKVRPGDRLAVLEAMKMETSVVAEFAGIVRRLRARPNQQVAAGAALLEIEPSGDPSDTVVASVAFDSLVDRRAEETDETARCLATLEQLRRMVLGFDVAPTEVQERVARESWLCDGEPVPGALELEDEILRIFVDLIALYRRQPALDEPDAARRTTREYLWDYLRDLDAEAREQPASFRDRLLRALAHYGVQDLRHTPDLEESLVRICKAHGRPDAPAAAILTLLERRLRHRDHLAEAAGESFRLLLHRLVGETQGRFPAIHDLALEMQYRLYDEPFLAQVRRRVLGEAGQHLEALRKRLRKEEREERIQALVDCTQPLHGLLMGRFDKANRRLRMILLEVLVRRLYRIRPLEKLAAAESSRIPYVVGEYDHDDGRRVHVIGTRADSLEAALSAVKPALADVPEQDDAILDVFLWRPEIGASDADSLSAELRATVERAGLPRPLRRLVISVAGAEDAFDGRTVLYFTFRPGADGYREEAIWRGLHPMMGKRLQLWRMASFEIERVPSPEDVYLFRGQARDNPKDVRLFATAEVRDITPSTVAGQAGTRRPELERVFMETLGAIRRYQSRLPDRERLHWNRIVLHVWPVIDMSQREVNTLIGRLEVAAEGLGLEKVVVTGRIRDGGSGRIVATVLDISRPGGRGRLLRFREPSSEPIRTLDEYTQQVVRLRRRGLPHPFEVLRLLAPPRQAAPTEISAGEFVEHDLDRRGRLKPVVRPPGGNDANVVVGVVRNFTAKHPEGMARVVIVGDPSQGMGNLAEPECKRIVAALDLAESMEVPLEWFAISAGARIAMDSGTENMDWIARVLRRLIEFTQAGHEVNLVITGINVGAQPYWNAEATMLMHTRGILVMMPESAMVLTGKEALDYSGGVSAEDNQGIGGYEGIMGPNGQAQYFARDLHEACGLLLRYYDHAYRAPGEPFPRRAETSDPIRRDIRAYPHGGEFDFVGDVFSQETNPDRKKPFDIRKVMLAVIDQDLGHLERWYGWKHAEIAVVWDSHIGGYPVCLLGLESKPLPRFGFVPADGPGHWTGGTLFPASSKKIARAINAASGNRPVVVLANLSGFDGSPESLRNLQLEFGAEIGRAVVNFRGPILFVDISRYHGGAFVVFSNALSDNMEVAALEGSFASVIGGAPAAAVVFARDVDLRTQQDPRVRELRDRIDAAGAQEKGRLRAQLTELFATVRSEKLGDVASEFDTIHSVERARAVGSVHTILPAGELRPWLVAALERGMARARGEDVPPPGAA